MRITALALFGSRGWPELELSPIAAGLNLFTGPAGSGKTTLGEFLSHALYGKPPAHFNAGVDFAPEGEAIVEREGTRFRLKRHHDGTRVGRLTVASPDGEAVDSETVRRLVGGLPPDVLRQYFAVNFASEAPADSAAAAEFVRAFRAITIGTVEPDRRTGELAARRDVLAQELESRIAGDRRLSADLERRRGELDRQIRETEQGVAALELRLRAVETALAETDARLRYRRLELNTELRWQFADAAEWEPELAELDGEIARWRATLADLAQREATVRSRLAQVSPGERSSVALSDQRSWIAVARQLAADLEGEVARLARASSSEQCVCSDAHPRLRPIVETLGRQLDQLTALINSHQRAASVKELTVEADQLAKAQTELRGQVEHLLDRRQALVDWHAPSRRRLVADSDEVENQLSLTHSFSAADAEQLEQRRLELEQQRFELIESLRARHAAVRALRAERDDLNRQRASLLSARSIEHIQRELAIVQRKLEEAMVSGAGLDDVGDGTWRASDFLAQLTDGRLVRLEYSSGDELAWAVHETGSREPLHLLTAGDRALVRLSFTLAIASAASRSGVHLPVVLDDPFSQLDSHAIAAAAAVLAAFARAGHQVLILTSQAAAIDRLATLGAVTFDMISSRRWHREFEPLTLRDSNIVSARAANQSLPEVVGAPAHRRSVAEGPESKRRPRSGSRSVENGARRTKRGDAA